MARLPDDPSHGETTPGAFEILRPAAMAGPTIFASPHSGREYPASLLERSRLDRKALRQSEDCYVDLLFDAAPEMGAPLLRALFPRAYVDVNRARDEIDPRMFQGATPRDVDRRSTRVVAGLGVIPRIVADGEDIYARKLRYGDAETRLRRFYDPYHAALRTLIADARRRFGCAVLIDCHSMPAAGGAPLHASQRPIDFVLGDRFGASCAPSLTHLVEQWLAGAGYEVAKNAPYAGGYVAARYGRPHSGVHVLQIEINRALYLDETRFARTEGFERLKAALKPLISRLVAIDAGELQIPQAAE